MILVALLPVILALIVAVVLVRRAERRRVERWAELVGLRRTPGESTASLRARIKTRLGAGLTVTGGGL